MVHRESDGVDRDTNNHEVFKERRTNQSLEYIFELFQSARTSFPTDSDLSELPGVEFGYIAGHFLKHVLSAPFDQSELFLRIFLIANSLLESLALLVRIEMFWGWRLLFERIYEDFLLLLVQLNLRDKGWIRCLATPGPGCRAFFEIH